MVLFPWGLVLKYGMKAITWIANTGVVAEILWSIFH